MSSGWLASLPVYLAIALPLVGAVLVVGLRLFRPTFQGLWFVALLCAALALAAVGFSRPSGFYTVKLLTWGPESILPLSPALLVDDVSWAFSVCLGVLLLSILLTAVVRLNAGSWRAWAGSLGLTGLGLVALMAGNPLTLLLAWSALDLLELLVQLFQVRQSSLREGGVLAFSARIAGTAALILAIVIGRGLGLALDFEAIPAEIAPLLILSAGLRLGVLPIQAPLLEEIPMRRGVGTALRLAPAAASLVLLARTANAQLAPALVVVFLVLSGVAALYSGIAWLAAKNELSGRPFWMLGLASLAVASAVHGSLQGVLAWGLALLFSGALLFLYSARHRGINLLLLVGALACSGAPFTPAWAGAWLFGAPSGQQAAWHWLANALFFLSLILLLLGYLRHALSEGETMDGREPWAWLVYPLGLSLLPVAHFILGWLNRPALAETPALAWFSGPAALAAALAAWWLDRRDPIRLPGEATFRSSFRWGATFWGQLLSLTWLYRLLWWLYRQASRLLRALNRLQEGDGGLLWAILLLLLVFSLAVKGFTGP